MDRTGVITRVYLATTANTEDFNHTECNPNGTTVIPCAQTEDPVKLQIRAVLRISTIVILCIVMTGMGCAAEVQKVLQHMKKPTGIVIGLISQFGFMPALAFAFAKIFSLADPETLSILIVGSCPGGNFSNIIAYWLKADMELSLTMTTISVICSMGTMPLLLFLYSLAFENNTISVAYTTIAISIATTIIPLALGMLIRYKWPAYAKRIVQAFSIIGFVTILGSFALFVYTYGGDWLLSAGQIVAAICLPVIGMISGYSLSSIVSLVPRLYLHHARRRVISIETGIQNLQIATAIIEISGWSIAITARVICFPLIYFLSQTFWSLVFVGSYRSYLLVKNQGAKRNSQDERESINNGQERTGTGAANPAFEDNME